MHQDYAEAENAEINVKDDKGPSKAEYEKDKGRRKADDEFGGPKQQRMKSKFSSYTELTETPKRIFLDNGGRFFIETEAKREHMAWEKKFEKFCIFLELDGHETIECTPKRHLSDLIEGQVWGN